MTNQDKIIARIKNFLNCINIQVIETELDSDTFLPGLRIEGNSIFIDPDKLKYPGDLLHEAGHIATTEEKLRPLIGTDKIGSDWPSEGEEIAAILWSFAASVHLGLDIKVVFHPNGYKNDSDWLIEQFTNKNYIGLPLLEWMLLCDKEEFPIMQKWLR